MNAPVVLFVYNREEHTKVVLNALNQNYDAEKTDLYIFSDGARDESERAKVEAVRKYLDQFVQETNFKKVDIKKSKRNRGLAESIISGVSEIMEQYGCAIVLEDDHLTSKDFIRYMNQGLEFYKNNHKIWSISGYTWKMKGFRHYRYDVFMGYRASCWGWASWKDRWERVDWNVEDYDNFIQNKQLKRKFNRGGLDMTNMLQLQHAGEINSWAVRWCYQQCKEEMWSVFPVHSKVENIGFDGSGTNSGKAKAFETEIIEDKQIVFENIGIDKRLAFEFWMYYSKLYMRKTLGKYWYLLTEYEYCVLYRTDKKETFQVMKPNFRYWYADPIPFTINDHYFVFVEMYDKLKGRGGIGVAEFDDKGKLKKPKQVIRESFHLSFPHVFLYQDAVFMIPECGESKEIRIYKMGKDVYDWQLYVSFPQIGFTDTVSYIEGKNKIYLISSIENSKNKYETRLVVLSLNNLQDLQKVSLELLWDSKVYSYDVRNGGSLFRKDNRLLRVVQHSTKKEYGKYITLNQVERIDEMGIDEKIAEKIDIGKLSYDLPMFIYRVWGTHTYGVINNLEVYDLSVQRFSVGGLCMKMGGRLCTIFKN